MKKTLLIVLCLLTLLALGSCKKEQNNMQTTNKNTVTFTSSVTDADVWILPDTKENKKTTVWGKATISKLKTGESRQAPLCEAGDDGLYILRMIDTDSFYYSADGIALKSGWTITVKEDDSHRVTADVTDENGVLKKSYEVFSARL